VGGKTDPVAERVAEVIAKTRIPNDSPGRRSGTVLLTPGESVSERQAEPLERSVIS